MKTIKFLGMAALALVGAIMTGCSSDDDVVNNQQPENNAEILTTTVSLSPDTRALTANGVKTFAEGDKMAVMYSNTSNEGVKAVSYELTASDISNDGKSATFTVKLYSPDKTKGVSYIYPAAMATDNGNVNYDKLAEQDGTLASLASELDCSYAAATSWDGANLPALELQNQFAILAFTLKNSDGSSEITSGITGMTVNYGKYTYNVSRTPAPGPIYLAIRPTGENPVQVMVAATQGSNVYLKSLTNKSYTVGNGYNLSLRMMVPVKGEFTINGSGDKVYFSPGNLQATTTDYGAHWKWHFAPTPWNYIGDNAANNSINGNGTVSANGTVDLFGWSTATTTYGINNSDNNSNYSGEFVDWGATIGEGWRTLTKDEWNYVCNTRTTGGTVFTTSKARYAIATINIDGGARRGIILFPDGVDIASNEVTTAKKINDTTSNPTRCTMAQWFNLALKGCVFLPATGVRSGSGVGANVFPSRYWSSTIDETNTVFSVTIGETALSLNSVSRVRGQSVRLVRPVQ